MKRHDIYNLVKRTANKLNIRMPLKYPRGTKKQYTDLLYKISKSEQYENLNIQRGVETYKVKKTIQERNFINKFKSLINNERDEVTITKNLLNISEIYDIIKKNINNQKILLNIKNNYYTLNYDVIENLNKLFYREEKIEGSDADIYTYINNEPIIRLYRIKDNIDYFEREEGGFFPYFNKTNLDLEEYGIYKSYNKEIAYKNCLIKVLESAKLDKKIIDNIKILCKNSYIPKCKLSTISDIIKHSIKLIYKNKKNNKTKVKNINKNKYKETINIGFLQNHYFLNSKVNCSKYAIKNYNNLKNKEKWNLFIKKDERNKKVYIKSFLLINEMLKNKDEVFEKINIDLGILKTNYYDIENINEDLEYKKEECCSLMEKKEDKINNNYKIFFDFETITTTNKHKPYLCCYETEDGIKKEFIGSKCGLNMLFSIYKLNKTIKKDIILIAHNLRYDFTFIVKYIYQDSPIIKNNKLLSCKGKFKDMKILFKDSYSMISMPLKNFNNVFNVEIEKEVMPYHIYNEENIKKRYISIEEIEMDNKEQFINNCKKWGILKNNKVDIIEYSKKYCLIDCNLLKIGYLTFEKWIKEGCNIDINNVLTSAGLAHKYMINNGCYEGVYELSKKPMLFIQKCIVGGRCMSKNNKKLHVKGKINDFDAVSLYPSAMYQMEGFLKGTPKVIINKDFEELNKYDGYFVEIEIKKVGIERSFPLLSYENKKEGVREFTNNLIGRRIYVDKITLNEAVKYQKIDFNIIRGYYFNEGRNKTINKVIEKIFNLRKEAKKNKNPIEAVYKLIMNSSYGKTILKPINEELKVKKGEDKFKNFIYRHYNYIKEIFKVSKDKYYIYENKIINDHYNLCHIGVEILSESKKIMNKVICNAEDEGINIFYQDTDSIHLFNKDIKRLEKIYKEKYNKNLIGTELGEFHSDFNLKDCNNVISNELIVLGKKSYLDCLEGIENKTGKNKTGNHYRMKGIPSKVIEYSTNDVKQIYLDLYKGKEIEFDLTNDGTKPCFKTNKDMSINTIKEFRRKLNFK